MECQAYKEFVCKVQGGGVQWASKETRFTRPIYLEWPQEVPEISTHPSFCVHLGCAAGS